MDIFNTEEIKDIRTTISDVNPDYVGEAPLEHMINVSSNRLEGGVMSLPHTLRLK